jgi:hypothetical protein
MRKIGAILCFVLFVSALAAQNNGYTFYYSAQRSIEPAYRISETPAVIDTSVAPPKINYPLITVQHATSITLKEIKPAKINLMQKLPKIYHSYVRLGIGNYLTPLGEVFINSTRSRKYHWGIQATHLSSWGKIKGYAPATFDKTNASIYGKIIEKKYDLTGKINFGNQGLHFYGIRNENTPKDSIKQRFGDYGINTDFTWHKKDSATLNYKIGVNYNHYNDRKLADSIRKWRAQENYFALNSNWFYRLKQQTYSANFDIKYNGYQYGIAGNKIAHPYDSIHGQLDSGIINNNYIVRLNPHVLTTGKNGKWDLMVGIDVYFDIHKNQKVKVIPVPNLAFHYSLFHDIFIPYVGINGGVQQNTFKAVSQTNNYVLSNLQLQNEYNTLNFYGGIRGVISKTISFDANIHYGFYKNKYLYNVDSTYSGGNRFELVYDNMSITKIEASISYQLNEKIKIDALGQFFSYQTKKFPRAWYLPTFQFMLRGHYNLFDKVYFNLDFHLQTGRYAQVYGPGKDIRQEKGYYYKKLGVLADLNLGIEYAFTKRISAFVGFNNLAAQRYKRWLNYPVQGFQVLGGFTFKF